VYRRDKTRQDRYNESSSAFVEGVAALLDDIQQSLFQQALERRAAYTRDIDSWDDFTAFFTPANPAQPEAHGGFAMAHWCDGAECEARVNEALSVSIRCIPLNRAETGGGACVVCGKPSTGRVVFAKAY